MSLKDVAYNLEMHESTVSRVTNRKYMQTPRGLFELKYFFSAAAGTYTGAEDISTLSIKTKSNNSSMKKLRRKSFLTIKSLNFWPGKELK